MKIVLFLTELFYKRFITKKRAMLLAFSFLFQDNY